MSLVDPTWSVGLARWVAPGCLYEGPAESGAVVLSFDDGPDERYTRELIEVLGKWGVAGSFFWLGEALKDEGNASAAREAIAAGHWVGIHGDRHVSFLMSRPAAVRAGLEVVRERIEALGGSGGREIREVRPPFGHVTRGWARRLEGWGYRVVMCSILPGDWNTGSAEVVRRVLRRVRGGAIIALHEGKWNGREAARTVDALVPRIQDLGLGFTIVGAW